ncbi:uncharacterized protein LOC135206767 [Macrobrachium nipponense]|uniref:uncharacterized protein LOC135206767 n=1 Tax=Macrobrachium nipponense TaxID=159736 RepID=UPI0030C7E055
MTVMTLVNDINRNANPNSISRSSRIGGRRRAGGGGAGGGVGGGGGAGGRIRGEMTWRGGIGRGGGIAEVAGKGRTGGGDSGLDGPSAKATRDMFLPYIPQHIIKKKQRHMDHRPTTLLPHPLSLLPPSSSTPFHPTSIFGLKNPLGGRDKRFPSPPLPIAHCLDTSSENSDLLLYI